MSFTLIENSSNNCTLLPPLQIVSECTPDKISDASRFIRITHALFLTLSAMITLSKNETFYFAAYISKEPYFYLGKVDFHSLESLRVRFISDGKDKQQVTQKGGIKRN